MLATHESKLQELKLLGIWGVLLVSGRFFIVCLFGSTLWQDIWILVCLAVLISRILYLNLLRLIAKDSDENQLAVLTYTATGSLFLIVVLTLIVCVLLLLNPEWKGLQEFWWSFVLFPYHVFLYSTALLWSIRLSWELAKLIAKMQNGAAKKGSTESGAAKQESTDKEEPAATTKQEANDSATEKDKSTESETTESGGA